MPLDGQLELDSRRGSLMPLLTLTKTGGTDVAVIFGVDVSSYQGAVNWKSVWNAGIRFGFSKVTQSTNYLNPTWHHNLAGMTALGNGFVPGAYHFLTAGNGAAQARYFVQAVGGAAKCRQLAIALDVEPTTGSRPSIADAKAWVAEFRKLVPGHPVVGYVPGWYHSEIGKPSLTFLDVIWQSNYVTGSGSPSALYAKAGQARWSGYGGRSVSILQFSSSGRVSGISGNCDVNAYRGTAAQLRALTIGGAPTPEEDDVPKRISVGVKNPVKLTAGKKTRVVFDTEYDDAGKMHANGHYPGILTRPCDVIVEVTVTGAKGVSELVAHDMKTKEEKSLGAHPMGESFTAMPDIFGDQHLYLDLTADADCEVRPYVKGKYWES